jgi:hypothetical protein
MEEPRAGRNAVYKALGKDIGTAKGLDELHWARERQEEM